jgi:hypothetical protein
MHGRQPSERPGSPLLRHRASESATELALASDEPKSCAFEPARSSLRIRLDNGVEIITKHVIRVRTRAYLPSE